MNALDRVISWLAPRWGLRRAQARAGLATIGRHYDAAGAGRRSSGWHRYATDVNAANRGAASKLRDLARDLRRNDGWARKGVNILAKEIVGRNGLQPRFEGATAAVVDQAQRDWRQWAPVCDYDARSGFAGIQRLVMTTIVEAGEAIILLEPAKATDNLAIPLRLRVLEGDYLYPHTFSHRGNPVHEGVEFDGNGRRIAYWLYQRHPGASWDGTTQMSSFTPVRVDASRVVHAYAVERAGQVRGVTWLAAAIGKLHELSDLNDAVLVQQKIAAAFGGFVTDLDGDPRSLGAQDTTNKHLEVMQPGMIQYLRPGQQVSFATPPPVAGQREAVTMALRSTAAAIGVTYEELTGDYSGFNYSSARASRLGFLTSVEAWRDDILRAQVCAPVFARVMELQAALRGWKQVPTATWTATPAPMLDPDREARAVQTRLRSGTQSLKQALRELGFDPGDHLQEIAESNRLLDSLGIVLDSDPRRTSMTGQQQQQGSTGQGQDSTLEPEDDPSQ